MNNASRTCPDSYWEVSTKSFSIKFNRSFENIHEQITSKFATNFKHNSRMLELFRKYQLTLTSY